MNKDEAKKLLGKTLESFKRKSYTELKEEVNAKQINITLEGSSGVIYQIEINIFWDDKPNGSLRVTGAIDDGGFRAFFPLTDDFIIEAPEKHV